MPSFALEVLPSGNTQKVPSFTAQAISVIVPLGIELEAGVRVIVGFDPWLAAGLSIGTRPPHEERAKTESDPASNTFRRIADMAEFRFDIFALLTRLSFCPKIFSRENILQNYY